MGHLITLVNASKIEAISLAISITVIVLLFITLAVSLYLYYRYYKKCIDNKIEDSYIKNEIKGENKKFFKRFESLKNNQELTKDQKIDRYNEELLVEYVDNKIGNNNFIKVIANLFLIIFYVCLIAVMGFAIYTRSQGDTIPLGNSYYVVIQTGSMEEKNSANTYLEENNLNDQIETFSLIGLDYVDSPDELEQYDIVAYYDDDNNLIVHRIINITYDENNNPIYTLRGDSNTFSNSDERSLTFDDIEGKYNGFQNFGLGLTINYMKSNIGIIAISLGLILIMIYDYFDILLGKRIKLRKEEIYPLIDEENINTLKGLTYVPAIEEEKLEENIIKEEVKEETIEEIHETPLEEVIENKEEVLTTNNEENKDEILVNQEINNENNLQDINIETQEENKSDIDVVVVPIVQKTKKARKKMIPFNDKLLRASDDLKLKYEYLRDYILSFGLKHRISRQFDNYSLHRVRYFCFVLRGKALFIHFKLDINDYADSTIPVKLDDKVKYQDVPVIFKVKSNLSLKRAKTLIDDVMSNEGFEQKYEFISHFNLNDIDETEEIEDDFEDEFDDNDYEIEEVETTNENNEEEKVVETDNLNDNEASNESVEDDNSNVEIDKEETDEDELEEETSNDELEDNDDDTEDEEDDEIDEESNDTEEEQNISFDSQSEENNDQVIKVKRKRNPVVKLSTKLNLIPQDLKEKYDEILKYASNYGLKGRISNTQYTFRLHRVTYIIVQIRNNALRLHFKLEESDFDENNKIPFKNDSKKAKFIDTPIFFKVKSKLSLKRCKMMIDVLAKKYNFEKKDESIN